MGIFERYLTIWVAGAITAGVSLGMLFPYAFSVLAELEIAHVNLVVAVLIWIMIYPMMVNVDLASLRHIGDRPKGLAITLVVNWLIKPFTMAGLGLLFFEVLFRPWVEPADAREYVAGMILLGAAPCTAMVFVWSQLVRGDATYTLVQVSVNDLIMIFAFAPLVALLLGVADVIVPWSTLLLSVVLYMVVPLGAGGLTRRALLARSGDEERVSAFGARLKPYTVAGLLATVVLLFAFQGPRILEQPDRANRRTSSGPELRNLLHRLRLGLGVGRALLRRRTRRVDRHIELLRAGGGGRHQSLRPAERRRPGNRRGRSRRSSGDALARRTGQPYAGPLPACSTRGRVIWHHLLVSRRPLTWTRVVWA